MDAKSIIPKELIFDNQKVATEYRKAVYNPNKIEFRECQFNFSYKFSKDTKEMVEFHNCIFTVDQSFENTIFNLEVSFINCEFNSEVNFSGCQFHKLTDFHDSKFQQHASFFDTTFNDKLNAWGMVFYKGVTFRWANIQKKANLTHMKVKGVADFHGVRFAENMYMHNGEFEILKLERSVIDKSFFSDVSISSAGRETFRIIKNEFLKQNDRIEALNYHAREMKAYKDNLRKEMKKNKGTFRWQHLKIIGDFIILKFNEVSNKFGLSWMTGIVFTLVTTIPLYYLYLYFVYPSSDLSFCKYYPQFLSPLHKLDFIENATLQDPAYVVDYIGRTFATLGIYQTVQAFRKYGRF
jgi:uncharacterized protein YjbI with pentapeptide repeats